MGYRDLLDVIDSCNGDYNAPEVDEYIRNENSDLSAEWQSMSDEEKESWIDAATYKESAEDGNPDCYNIPDEDD